MRYNKNIKLPSLKLVNCHKEILEDKWLDKCRFVWRILIDIQNVNILYCESPFQYYDWNNEPNIRASFFHRNWKNWLDIGFPQGNLIRINPYYYALPYKVTQSMLWLDDFNQWELPFINDVFWFRAIITPHLEEFIHNLYKECVELLLKERSSSMDTSISQVRDEQIDYALSPNELLERVMQNQLMTSQQRQYTQRLHEAQSSSWFQILNEVVEAELIGNTSTEQATHQSTTVSCRLAFEMSEEMNLPLSTIERQVYEMTPSTMSTHFQLTNDNSTSSRIEAHTPYEIGEDSISSTPTQFTQIPTISQSSLRRNELPPF